MVRLLFVVVAGGEVEDDRYCKARSRKADHDLPDEPQSSEGVR
ncbi:hypothetical protein [Nannocystis pusilla]|nr:hypothetical protein [Nannocystis pusilla]